VSRHDDVPLLPSLPVSKFAEKMAKAMWLETVLDLIDERETAGLGEFTLDGDRKESTRSCPSSPERNGTVVQRQSTGTERHTRCVQPRLVGCSRLNAEGRAKALRRRRGVIERL